MSTRRWRSEWASSSTRQLLHGLAAALALGGVAASCAGASDAERGPRASLDAYAQALAEGRADDAYRLLSDDAKRSVSIEAFRRMVAENPEDVQDIARALRRPGSAPVVTATVLAPNGERLTLVYEDGSWRVDGTGIDRYGQATPRQALLGFLLAFERKRYDVILRYVPHKELVGSDETAWGEPGESLAAAPPSEPPAGEGGSAAVPVPGGSASPPQPPAAAPRRGGLTAAKLRAAWEGEQKKYITRIVQAIKSALPTARIEQTDDRAAMPYGAGGTVLFVREDGLWKIEDLQ